MGKWWKFGRDKDRSESTPAPAPAPSPEPQPSAEPSAPAEKKSGGFLSRLFGRSKQKVAPETPPAEPAPPAEPPASPPSPPTTGGGGGGGEGGGAEEGEGAPEPERVYPSSLTLSVQGTWVISSSIWHGPISGTLTGANAKAFVIHMEKGNEESAIRLLADAYDDKEMGFARYLDTGQSSWDEIIY
ncbi:hypothetical protein OG599_35385 (plasmid) [Streptomyces sp. NBC_01335]|uniref:hypothetical protein n=1 Tax=Streptomyces sp. NBC_01335 TaxID=2903828 RepID=UPI002E0D62F8|nr:hypothetical protein OG599_35385 [Streptomyces sp. NBC_01335]